MYRPARDNVQRKESSKFVAIDARKTHPAWVQKLGDVGNQVTHTKSSSIQAKKQWMICQSTNKCSANMLKMTKDLLPGTFVFTDNLFSSMELLKELNKRGLNFVCTFRRNRFREAKSKL